MADVSTKKAGAKGVIKDLAPCLIITFVCCYMLFLYEPLMMYATNRYELWFDLQVILLPLLSIFAMFFIGAAAVLTGLYFLCRKFTLKPYRIVLTVLFGAFLTLYVQGNYLIGHLPALDGSETDWGAFGADDLITLAVVAVVTAGLIFAGIKFGLARLVKYAAWVSAAVFVMLTASFVSTTSNRGMFLPKDSFLGSVDGFNGASSDKNFFIFMVDSQSATEFSEVISREEFDGTFDDFTYYPDTTSVYAYTRDSVPYVLSGRVNKNEEDFDDYCSSSLNNSTLFKALEERGYDISIYDMELVWYGDKSFDILNDPDSDKVELKFGEYFNNEMRYVWFKYLPYVMKRFSDIENLDFGRTIEKFRWENIAMHDEFIENPELELSSGAQFRFIHAEGAHVPFNNDENFNLISNGTYIQKTTATAKLIKEFIERLKANGVYDNSAIIIMADHGYQPLNGAPDNYILSRFNPILLIKGVNEKHDFAVSDKPVSYFDLPNAYTELLDGKQSTDLFADIEYPRTRTVIWYEIYKEKHMVEYAADGKATEWDKFRETGNVFDLVG